MWVIWYKRPIFIAYPSQSNEEIKIDAFRKVSSTFMKSIVENTKELKSRKVRKFFYTF